MEIDYRIIYSNRKTLALVVERDRSIVVRAPIGTSEEAIRQAVEAKKLWLYEKVNHAQKMSGVESGRPHRLEDEETPLSRGRDGVKSRWGH